VRQGSGGGRTAGAGVALPSFARRVEGGIEIALKVVPGASRSEVVGPLGGRLKLKVAAPPERGRANDAAIRLLREWLGVHDVEIVAGLGSSVKAARIRFDSHEELEKVETMGPQRPERRRWLDRLLDFEKRTGKR
jgi:uncharacterized protein